MQMPTYRRPVLVIKVVGGGIDVVMGVVDVVVGVVNNTFNVVFGLNNKNAYLKLFLCFTKKTMLTHIKTALV